jgi:hypothetical protein
VVEDGWRTTTRYERTLSLKRREGLGAAERGNASVTRSLVAVARWRGTTTITARRLVVLETRHVERAEDRSGVRREYIREKENSTEVAKYRRRRID